MLRNHASGPTSKGAVCLPSSNSRYCLRQRSRLHADRSSQLEVRANNSDESLRLHFPGTERRLKPRSNRRPFLLVLRWKRRKELSQIFLNGFRDSRPRFAGEGCSNPEHVGTVLGDVLAFSFFPFCGALRQIDVCARLERNQRCRIRERKIVFFVVLVSDECIVIVVQQIAERLAESSSSFIGTICCPSLRSTLDGFLLKISIIVGYRSSFGLSKR